jgi:hypothetical protein
MEANAENPIAATSDTKFDRRQYSRRDCDLCIIAVPVDGSGKEIGAVVAGHCVDISDSGIRITLAAEIDSELVRIEPVIDGEELGFKSAVFKVVRHKTEYWCSTYAGPFVEQVQSERCERAAASSPLWPLGAPFAE